MLPLRVSPYFIKSIKIDNRKIAVFATTPPHDDAAHVYGDDLKRLTLTQAFKAVERQGA
jgi:hypothetical protein